MAVHFAAGRRDWCRLPILQSLRLEPLLARVTGSLPDVSQFAPLIGNTFFLVLSLVVSWTLAAFGEELVYRGYLMNRVVDLVGAHRRVY